MGGIAYNHADIVETPQKHEVSCYDSVSCSRFQVIKKQSVHENYLGRVMDCLGGGHFTKWLRIKMLMAKRLKTCIFH